MITPTVGRIVLFKPARGDSICFETPTQADPLWGDVETLAGMVAHVNKDGSINIAVADVFGNSHARQNVPLIQDDAYPDDGPFAFWMPYQKAQAAKADGAPESAVIEPTPPAPIVEPVINHDEPAPVLPAIPEVTDTVEHQG